MKGRLFINNLVNNGVKKNDKTLEDKIAILKEILAETGGWGINELLMGICDYYTSWHMRNLNETYTKLAKAYDYDYLVESLKQWTEEENHD